MNESKEMQMRETAHKLFRQLATALIKHGENLETDAIVDSRRQVQITPRAHREDHGKILGAKGKTFEALKMILALVGVRQGVIVMLNRLRDPEVGEREFPTPCRYVENFDHAPAQAQLEKVLKLILKFPFSIRVTQDETDHATRFFMRVDPREVMPITPEELARILSTVFHGIGKAKGRNIYVDPETESVPAAK